MEPFRQVHQRSDGFFFAPDAMPLEFDEEVVAAKNADQFFNGALTLTLSRPTGEGTAMGRFFSFEWRFGKSRSPVFRETVRKFSLSHRMGKGRGEGWFARQGDQAFG